MYVPGCIYVSDELNQQISTYQVATRPVIRFRNQIRKQMDSFSKLYDAARSLSKYEFTCMYNAVATVR